MKRFAMRAGVEVLLGAGEGERTTTLWEDVRHVARFVREGRAFRVRPDDVFISSYPRSGTTWMQLVVHLVRGGSLDFRHIADVVPWYERPLAHGRVTARELAARPSPRSFKSHLPYAWLPKGARYLYIYRDGRDVLVSYYHFYRSHLGYGGDLSAFFERFVRGDLQYGSWFRHVAHWQRHAGRPNVLLLRYEDMRSDPEPGLHAIAKLCGVTLSRERIRSILDVASFEAMQRAEEKFDHATSEPGHAGPRREGAFVRRGQVGDHRAHLTAEQHARFERLLQGPVSARPSFRLAAFLQ